METETAATSEDITSQTASDSDSYEIVSSTDDLNESIFTRSRESTKKELMELKNRKTVKESLKPSRYWTVLASSINVKHSRLPHTNYIGWDGLKTEKESDIGKVGRIQVDQREELNALRSMRLVQRTLQEDKDISYKTNKLFPIPSSQQRSSTHNVIISNPSKTRKRDEFKKSVRKKSQAIVSTLFSVPSKRRRVLDRLTTEQLTSIGNAEVKRTHQIPNHYKKKKLSEPHPFSTKPHPSHSSKPHLKRNQVIHSESDEDDSTDNDTLDHLSDREFGSTSTLAAEKPFVSKTKSLSTPSPLLVIQQQRHSLDEESESKVGGARPPLSRSVQEDGPGMMMRSFSNETSSDCYSSQSSSYSTGFSSQSTQSSFEWELTKEEGETVEDEEKEEVVIKEEQMMTIGCEHVRVSPLQVVEPLPSLPPPPPPSSPAPPSSSYSAPPPSSSSTPLLPSSSIPHPSSSPPPSSPTPPAPSSPPPPSPPPPPSSPPPPSPPPPSSPPQPLSLSANSQTLSDSLTSFTIDYNYSSDSDSSPVHEKPRPQSGSFSWLESAHLMRSDSSTSSTSYQYYRHSITSPAISDTPLDLLDNHPLSCSGNDLKYSGQPNSDKLPDKFFEDPQFVEYCKQLDHPPTKDDYATYRILILSELIEEEYGKKLEAALHEVLMIALKKKLGYNDFTRISHKLALGAKYFQERMVLITCFGRMLFEKMPNLKETISDYTAYAIEEMALVGLDWEGDTPYNNPEMRMDYDDWRYSNKREALEENSVPNSWNKQVSESPDCSSNSLTVPPSSNLWRSNSVEVLVDQSETTLSLSPPAMQLLLKRRCSWGNVYIPPHSQQPPSTSPLTTSTSTTNGQLSPIANRNDSSIMKVTTTEEVSLHLETFRGCPTASRPIVFSLSTQSSVDSLASSGAPSIRTIRGSDISSLSSGTPSVADKGSLGGCDELADPFIDIIQPIFEEEENSENDRSGEFNGEGEGERKGEGKEGEGKEGEGKEGEVNGEVGEELIVLRKRKNLKIKPVEERKGEGEEVADGTQNGDEVKIPTRKTSTQMLSEAMTSPILTIGLPVAVVAALALAKQ